MEGWIKLHRSILDNWVFQDDKYFRWWTTILLLVNHEAKEFVINGSHVVCKAGESFRSVENWAYYLRSSKKTVLQFFKILEEKGMIKCVVLGNGNRRKHLLTVINWEIYQSKSTETVTIKAPELELKVNQNKPPNKKDKKEENEKNTSPIIPYDQSSEFRSYQDWCAVNAPNVLRMKSPMTVDELRKLKEVYKLTAILTILQNMDNVPNLLTKYRSTYSTCLNWLNRANERGQNVLLGSDKPQQKVIISQLDYPVSKDNVKPMNKHFETERQYYHRMSDWAKALKNIISEEEYRKKYPYDRSIL